MSASDRPTDPTDSTESIDLEAGDPDTRPMNHLEDTMTTPTTAGAPPTAQATADTTAFHDPGPAPVAPRRGVRVGTIVWGLVIAAIGVGILAFALDVTFDAQLATIIVIFAAGALLLIGSIATTRRRRG
jgi:hypothetical protein